MTVINASTWYKNTYLHYVMYAPTLQTLLFIENQILQAQNFNLHRIALALKQYNQAFACLIVDTHNHEYFLIRDHFGFEPFYYTIITESQQLCFGSTLPDILLNITNPIQDKQLIEQVLTDICISGSAYTDKTFYENVWRVTPGNILQLRLFPKLQIKHHTYWELTSTPYIQYSSDDDYDMHFAALLQEACTVCCQQTPDNIGLEFSGGLDTSAILTALDKLGSTTQLFMHIGAIEDERRFAEKLLTELKSSYLVHHINADDFEIITVLNQCKQWFAGGAPYLFFMLAANVHQSVQQHGCKTLLSGFGGDECVSSHAVLRTYGATVGFKSLWRELIATNNNSSIRSFLQTIQLIQPHLYYWIQCVRSYRSNLAQKQAPIHYKPYYSLQEREADWLTGKLSYHVRMRIEYSAVVARNMGFTYKYPLLYPPLVEYCFALPPTQKRRQGQNRVLMRRYLAHHLPSKLFDSHIKCGDILPSTLPKCQNLYTNGQLNYVLKELPYNEIYASIRKNQLITDDRLFHLDLLRYMFK